MQSQRRKVCLTHRSCGMSGASVWNKTSSMILWGSGPGQFTWYGEVCSKHTLEPFAHPGTQSGWETKNAQQTPQVSSVYHFWEQTTKPAWKHRGGMGRERFQASTADSRGHAALTHNFYWVDYISLPVSACLSHAHFQGLGQSPFVNRTMLYISLLLWRTLSIMQETHLSSTMRLFFWFRLTVMVIVWQTIYSTINGRRLQLFLKTSAPSGNLEDGLHVKRETERHAMRL